MDLSTSRCTRGIFALLLLLLLQLALTFQTAHGFECYRCMSTNSSRPFLCNEFLTHGYDIEPESCDDVYGAKYCVKHIGRFEGGIGTKRFCSSVDLGNYCDYVKQPGDKLTYRTCVFTCDTNGCNPAPDLKPSKLVNSFLAVVSFGFAIFRR